MLKKGLKSLFLVIVGVVMFSQLSMQALDFSDFTVVDDSKFEEARDKELARIIYTLKIDFKNAYEKFTGNLIIEAVTIGEYDEAKMNLFENFIEDSINDFKSKCKSSSDAAILSYYNFLDEQGRSGSTGKDPIAKKLLKLIENGRLYFESKVVEYKNTLVLGGSLEDFTANLSNKISDIAAQKEADFRAKQAQAVILKHTEWDVFVNRAEMFGPIFGEKLLDGLAEVLEESLSDIGKNAAKLLGEFTVELTDLLKEKVSKLLEKVGKKLTPKVEEMIKKSLPAINELLKLFGAKIESASLELLFIILKGFLKDLMKPEQEFKDVEVRMSNELSDDEKMFISVRLSKAATVLKDKFNISIPLKMAMMSGGGGSRAMLGYMGFILGAEEAGLWDAMLYNVSSSSSSWLTMPFAHAHVLSDGELTMEDYHDALIANDRMAANPPGVSDEMLIGSADWFVKEFAYGLPLSSADIAGLFYATPSILDDDQTGAKMSDISRGILSGTTPLPLCSGVYFKGNLRTNEAKQKAKDAEAAAQNTAKDKESSTEDKESSTENKENATGDKEKTEVEEQADTEESGEDVEKEAAVKDSQEDEDEDKNEDKNEDVEDPFEDEDIDAAINDALDQIGKMENGSTDNTEKGEIVAQALSSKTTQYGWMEWSPFEVGGKSLGFVPVWAFGAEFNNGKIVTGIPEYPLYNYLGLWGSSYAASLNDVMDATSGRFPKPSFDFFGREVKMPVSDWIGAYLDAQGFNVGEARLLAPRYLNYSKGMATSSLRDEEIIEVVDSGLDFSMPFPLLMNRPEREMDLIFMFHADPGIESIFADAVVYFKREGIEYPEEFDNVTTESLASQPMTVFNDPRSEDYQKELTTFIYVPFLNCPAYADVFNFSYSGAQIAEISNLVKQTFDAQLNEMIEVMEVLAIRKGDVELLSEIGSDSEEIHAQSLSSRGQIVLKNAQQRGNDSINKLITPSSLSPRDENWMHSMPLKF